MLKRWNQPNGYRDVLKIGLPLVISMGSASVMQFTDRIFLSHYSLDAIAAALPAGIVNLLFMSFFMGVAGYVNVFIAQYIGSGEMRRVGASLWQGLFFCGFAWLFLASLHFFADGLFGISGHPEEVVRLEKIYFSILTVGAGIHITGICLSCFFSGRGLTKPIMVVGLIGTALNIPLDYIMINGVQFGNITLIPDLGIAGAGLATVLSWLFIAAMYAFMIFTKDNEKRFGVRKENKFDKELFRRLMRYGLPGGAQFCLEIFAITFFIFMVGRLAKNDLAATNIVFSLETLAFFPMLGIHITISVLVGQSVGRGRPEEGAEAAKSGVHIVLAYMLFIGIFFLGIPRELLEMFKPNNMTPEAYASIMETGVVLLRFVMVYLMFDAFSLVFFGAIKGAGDTMFIMYIMACAGVFIMIGPILVVTTCFNGGLYALWTIFTAYIATLGISAYARYRQGKWKGMNVIGAVPESV